MQKGLKILNQPKTRISLTRKRRCSIFSLTRRACVHIILEMCWWNEISTIHTEYIYFAYQHTWHVEHLIWGGWGVWIYAETIGIHKIINISSRYHFYLIITIRMEWIGMEKWARYMERWEIGLSVMQAAHKISHV